MSRKQFGAQGNQGRGEANAFTFLSSRVRREVHSDLEGALFFCLSERIVDEWVEGDPRYDLPTIPSDQEIGYIRVLSRVVELADESSDADQASRLLRWEDLTAVRTTKDVLLHAQVIATVLASGNAVQRRNAHVQNQVSRLVDYLNDAVEIAKAHGYSSVGLGMLKRRIRAVQRNLDPIRVGKQRAEPSPLKEQEPPPRPTLSAPRKTSKGGYAARGGNPLTRLKAELTDFAYLQLREDLKAVFRRPVVTRWSAKRARLYAPEIAQNAQIAEKVLAEAHFSDDVKTTADRLDIEEPAPVRVSLVLQHAEFLWSLLDPKTEPASIVQSNDGFGAHLATYLDDAIAMIRKETGDRTQYQELSDRVDGIKRALRSDSRLELANSAGSATDEGTEQRNRAGGPEATVLRTPDPDLTKELSRVAAAVAEALDQPAPGIDIDETLLFLAEAGMRFGAENRRKLNMIIALGQSFKLAGTLNKSQTVRLRAEIDEICVALEQMRELHRLIDSLPKLPDVTADKDQGDAQGESRLPRDTKRPVKLPVESEEREVDAKPQEPGRQASPEGLGEEKPAEPQSAEQPQKPEIDAEENRPPRPHEPTMKNIELEHENLRLHIALRRALNFALVHNGLSMISTVSVENRREQMSAPFQIVLHLESPNPMSREVSLKKTVSVDSVLGNSTRVVDSAELSWELPDSFFAEVEETQKIGITVETLIDGETVGQEKRTLSVHPPDEWWRDETNEALSAFIKPNASVVTKLLKEVAGELEATTGDSSLVGYQRGADRVHQTAEAAYRVLSALQVDYVEAPPSFREGSQRIRSHEEVVESGVGTCLDLALLYAALLEAAGIAPILVLADTHAFVGYLTDDTQLSESIIDSENGIHTTGQSDLFTAVEVTGVTARKKQLSFAEARDSARRWWPTKLRRILSLVDVRASHRWFRPLPNFIYRDGLLVVEKPAEEPLITPLHYEYPETFVDDDDAPPRVKRWRKELLDLTFRNPLLKIKPASSLRLMVPHRDLGLLEDRLNEGETIVINPSPASNDRHTQMDTQEAQDSLRKELRSANTVLADLNETQLKRRVTDLRRKAKDSREEAGADSLYLALGTLEWEDQRSTGAGPVFLIPVVLEGAYGVRAAQIRLDTSREVEPNYSLFERLRIKHGLELPELLQPGADSSGINVDGAFRRIRNRLMKVKATEFALKEKAYLATFQFSTLHMWRDLGDNWEELGKGESVQRLVEGVPSSHSLTDTLGEDDRLTETEAFVPLPVDSAQLEAIDLALRGQSFVLEGPPGTGKSQTITNLIAHSLAQGKKVLFVAEKQAALDVVEKRLRETGLTPFCLELHGDSQAGNAVRERLQESRAVRAQSHPRARRAENNFKDSAEYLNNYSQKIHEKGPNGSSLWDAHQFVLGASEDALDAEDPIMIPRRRVLDQASVGKLHSLAEDLAQSLRMIDGLVSDSKWSIAGPTTPPSGVKLKVLEQSTQILGDIYDSLSPVLKDLVTAVDTEKEATVILDWLEARGQGMAQDPTLAVQARLGWLAKIDQMLNDMGEQAAAGSPLNVGYQPDVLNLDLVALRAAAAEAESKFFGRKRRLQAVQGQLERFVVGQEEPPPNLVGILDLLIEAKQTNLAWLNALQQTPLPVPPTFNMYDSTQVDRTRGHVLGWQISAELGLVLQSNPGLQEAFNHILDLPNIQIDTLRQFLGARWDFERAAGISKKSRQAWQAGRSWQEAFEDSIEDWVTDALTGLSGYQAYAQASSVLYQIDQLGIEEFSNRVRKGDIGASDVVNEMDLAIQHAVREERLHTQNFTRFQASHRERMARRFVDSGKEYRRIIQEQVARKVVESRDEKAFRSPWGKQFIAQLAKRRNAMSVRRLMHDYFDLVTQLTPCFLMSPSSVAKFLPPGIDNFDLVVFDEASQIRVPQAIGAMGRGKTVIIVGDSQQMPPSSMFQGSSNIGEEELGIEEEAVVPVDMESILSEAVESSFDRVMLSWHYRSRDESLIAFSNKRYYDGRLASFPSPPGPADVPRTAISLVRVDGVWEGGSTGAARVNQAEAKAIVTAIEEQLVSDPSKSIGVVTFNIQQRNLVLDLLEQKSVESDAVAIALADDDEPIFVKNLENVQGDERDIIFFSLAFSPDKQGRIQLNWGPLTRTGGEKRLNVAVTRAKEKVVIFSSFDPMQFDLGSSRSVGLRYLKEYLLQAQNAQLMTQTGIPDQIDLHHDEVRDALESAGLEVQEFVGLSDFVVDLAVSVPGRRWMGILLEGPNWHKRHSVSDREGLPRQVLVDQMGWAAVRTLALPEWINDKQAAIQGIVDEASKLPEWEGSEPA